MAYRTWLKMLYEGRLEAVSKLRFQTFRGRLKVPLLGESSWQKCSVHVLRLEAKRAANESCIFGEFLDWEGEVSDVMVRVQHSQKARREQPVTDPREEKFQACEEFDPGKEFVPGKFKKGELGASHVV